jgi:hypothetical protein
MTPIIDKNSNIADAGINAVTQAEVNHSKSSREGQDWLRPLMTQHIHPLASPSGEDHS